jgi:hypothetical protein
MSNLQIKILIALALVLPSVALAQAPLTIVPNQGQTAEQLAADQATCANQAVAQSGYNPSAPPPTAQATRPVAGERVRGAARGAAAGAIREENTDAADREVKDLTESAARLGAAAGGARQRTERREVRRQTQAAQASSADKHAAYNQVFTSCMTAKGYTVQ